MALKPTNKLASKTTGNAQGIGKMSQYAFQDKRGHDPLAFSSNTF